MVEKLASSEIAQSRERSKSESLFSSHIGPVFGPVGYDFDDSQREKIFAFTDWCIDKAERDTRERCAKIADELCKTYESQSQNLAAHYAELVAERIRGKE